MIERQRAAGLQTVTDGELRRTSWHMDFIYSLGGVRQVEGESLHVQFRDAAGEQFDYAPPAMQIGKVTLPQTIFADAFTFLRDHAAPEQTPKLTIPSPSMVHYRGRRLCRRPRGVPGHRRVLERPGGRLRDGS